MSADPTHGAPFAVRVPRDVVRVSGPDAVSYLQGQISQDVAALVPGGDAASAWSFVLQPQGKVDAWFRITRTADDAFVLDVDGGWGERLVQRLERFKLRVKLAIEPLDWRCVGVRGVVPAADALRGTGAELVLPVEWPGTVGVDLLGPAVAVPPGVPEQALGAYEAWRIEVGMPEMGAELDERTIPAEAGVVDRSVSFTKGCYTGQELVARVDSRGSNTPRRLRRITRLETAGPDLQPGAPVVVDGKQAGTLTSATADRALAYIGRAVDVPADATVDIDGQAVAVRIEPLPA
jgi:folate-binding protein YgfZ